MATNRIIKVIVKEREADSYEEPEGYILYGRTNGGMKTGYVELTFYKMEVN